jgi:hypothetical protein
MTDAISKLVDDELLDKSCPKDCYCEQHGGDCIDHRAVETIQTLQWELEKANRALNDFRS